jgi:hypothetical protein
MFVTMTRHRTLLVVVAALLIVFAGCSSIGSQGSPTATPAEGTPSETATPEAEQLRGQAVDAMDEVEQYRVRANESRTVVANLEQQLSIEQDVAIDRATGNLHVDVTQSSGQRTVNVDNYVVNDTLYQRNPGFVEQFSTEWAVVDTVENLTRLRQALDPLWRQQRILEVSEAAYNGTETVDGTRVHRLETTSAPERFEDFFVEQVAGPGSQMNESSYSISNASFTFWVSSETYRPVKVAGRMNSSIASRGQTVSLEQSFSFEYDYGASVSIELPEEADSAVRLSEALNDTAGG